MKTDTKVGAKLVAILTSFKELETLAHLENHAAMPSPICDFGRLLAKRINPTTPINGDEFYQICRELVQDLMTGKIRHSGLAEKPERFYERILVYVPMIAKVVYRNYPRVSEETRVRQNHARGLWR